MEKTKNLDTVALDAAIQAFTTLNKVVKEQKKILEDKKAVVINMMTSAGRTQYSSDTHMVGQPSRDGGETSPPSVCVQYRVELQERSRDVIDKKQLVADGLGATYISTSQYIVPIIEAKAPRDRTVE